MTIKLRKLNEYKMTSNIMGQRELNNSLTGHILLNEG
jgi:hypothetical protein